MNATYYYNDPTKDKLTSVTGSVIKSIRIYPFWILSFESKSGVLQRTIIKKQGHKDPNTVINPLFVIQI